MTSAGHSDMNIKPTVVTDKHWSYEFSIHRQPVLRCSNKLFSDGGMVKSSNSFLVDMQHQHVVQPFLPHFNSEVGFYCTQSAKQTFRNGICSRYHKKICTVLVMFPRRLCCLSDEDLNLSQMSRTEPYICSQPNLLL